MAKLAELGASCAVPRWILCGPIIKAGENECLKLPGGRLCRCGPGGLREFLSDSTLSPLLTAFGNRMSPRTRILGQVKKPCANDRDFQPRVERTQVLGLHSPRSTPLTV